MLLELHIRNIALVDELNVSFAPGLNILTGETGAGKSIIVGAAALLRGETLPEDQRVRIELITKKSLADQP